MSEWRERTEKRMAQYSMRRLHSRSTHRATVRTLIDSFFFPSTFFHVISLKRLIFLDLYDNQIEEITGLNSLRSLRVLMLGKNK